ncbi:MAG: NAD(P)H-hydrate epimerase [Crocinitomicaceae bacterium]|jgi:NAD(P)H-hydrate epimerase
MKEITFPKSQALELNDFKEMDYYAIENYNLPIELMMENAGLQLANLIAHSATKDKKIRIGVGNGNNGGGGLVAARRLLGWGYKVSLDLVTEITRELPALQLTRAMKFGATLDKQDEQKEPDVWVDAYLGFSQRLPLNEPILKRIEKANSSPALKISLDIPTGFLGDVNQPYFEANKVMTLAAPKSILYELKDEVELFVADLGIPREVYKKFNVEPIEFNQGNIVRLKR